MEWKKRGLIIEPSKKYWWMQSHAMLPTPIRVKNNVYRVYFSGRDKKNRSIISYGEVEITNHNIELLSYSNQPVLLPGERGTFDDNGVTPSCIIDVGEEKKFLYYIGWNSGTSTVRMSLVAGLAISEDNGNTFQRYSRAPILQRTNREPFSILTAPFLLKEDPTNLKMYYVSGEGWIHKDLPRYNIKIATSKDGITWNRNGYSCIEFKNENETALARPCVIKEEGLYKMWFSYKDPSIGYRVGYAESNDGYDWNRKDDKAGIDVSDNGWDSEMIEYSYVFDHLNYRYMLYNGNNYGLNGIGYATLENKI